MGKISGDLKNDRKTLRDAISSIAEFDGITGKMKFDDEGDPIKCAVVVKISDTGEFVFTESVCP